MFVKNTSTIQKNLQLVGTVAVFPPGISSQLNDDRILEYVKFHKDLVIVNDEEAFNILTKQKTIIKDESKPEPELKTEVVEEQPLGETEEKQPESNKKSKNKKKKN